MRLIQKKYLEGYSYYNVATQDRLTVTEIAKMVVFIMGLKNVEFKYTGGNRGWKADIPIIELNSNKLRSLSWTPKYNSEQATKRAIISILEDIENGNYNKE